MYVCIKFTNSIHKKSSWRSSRSHRKLTFWSNQFSNQLFFLCFFSANPWYTFRPERENLPLIRYGNHESRREQIQVWFTIHLFYLDAIMHPSCISGNSYMGGLCREGGSLIIRGTTRKVAEWRGDFSRFVPLLTHVQLHNSIVISIRMPFSRRAFRFIPSAKGSAMGRRSSL